MTGIIPLRTYRIKTINNSATIFARVVMQNWEKNLVEYEWFDALNWQGSREKCSPEEFLKQYEQL